MAPPRMIAKEQQEILVDFLEANKDMSKGLNRCAPMTHITMRQKWSVLAKKLNAVESGIMKAPDGWKRYWFEWRFKCKKKAKKAMLHQANPNQSRSRHVSLNNLEIRVLELSGDASVNVTPTVLPSKQLDSVTNENSDTEQMSNEDEIDNFSPVEDKHSTNINDSKIFTGDLRSGTPPPRWALDLEERRMASQEKMADALQSIASTLCTQEKRRSMLDDKIANTLSALAGTIQDLNSGVHDMIQHIQNNKETSSKVIFL